jgi:hypothetical protein
VIRELPTTEWSSFLEAFSMQHDRWLVNVENLRGSNCDLEVKSEPLEGIMARPREIIITVGGNTNTHRRVIVRDPQRVSVESDGGVDQALQIEEPDGSVTRVAFRSPIAPELVDGLPP